MILIQVITLCIYCFEQLFLCPGSDCLVREAKLPKNLKKTMQEERVSIQEETVFISLVLNNSDFVKFHSFYLKLNSSHFERNGVNVYWVKWVAKI